MSLHATPSQTVGPYYRLGLEPLYRAQIAPEHAAGTQVQISGCVFDGAGMPVSDAVLELWQADAAGIYAHAHGADKEQLCKRARELVDMGFNLLKTGFEAPVAFVENQQFLRNCVERFAALREEVGPEVDLALDFHGRFSPTMSKRLIKELEPLYPYFVEEPCLPGNTAALVELKNSTTVPLATGERIFTKWGFRDLIEQRAVDILQPDLCHAGGIMEVKKISAMAEAQGRSSGALLSSRIAARLTRGREFKLREKEILKL